MLGPYHSLVPLLFSRVVSAVAVFSYNHAGSFDRLLTVIKLESSACMCQQMTHARSHVFFLFFFFLSFYICFSTSWFFSTDLALEWSNKVVSMATQKQVTDSQWCHSPCCQTRRTSSHFIILNIEPFLSQVEVRVQIHWKSLHSIDLFVLGIAPLYRASLIKTWKTPKLIQEQRENPLPISSLWFVFVFYKNFKNLVERSITVFLRAAVM